MTRNGTGDAESDGEVADGAGPGPSSEDGLTIGELARATGLTPATLRAWEARHGFPVPQRRSSGHRRYDRSEVARVTSVLRRRDAGVRLDSAIAEVLAVRRQLPVSLFAEMRRTHPQLAPQRLSKATLLALTWAMEDECCARAQRPMLFAAFQHERFYQRAQDRWRDLTRTAARTVVFAAFDEEGEEQGGVSRGPASLVHLPAEAPMRREWSLVCDAPDHPAALAAWELPGQGGIRDRDRVFESVWTMEPPGVRDAARACVGLVQDLAPEMADGFDSLDANPGEASADLRAAQSVFSRMVAYLDHGR